MCLSTMLILFRDWLGFVSDVELTWLENSRLKGGWRADMASLTLLLVGHFFIAKQKQRDPSTPCLDCIM